MTGAFRKLCALIAPAVAFLSGCQPTSIGTMTGASTGATGSTATATTYMAADPYLKVTGLVRDSITSNELTNIRVTLLCGTNQKAWGDFTGAYTLYIDPFTLDTPEKSKFTVKAEDVQHSNYIAGEQSFNVNRIPHSGKIDFYLEKKTK